MTDTAPKRHAGWAVAAIVTAMLGLFLDTLAPVLGVLAIVFALLGLRQTHRYPAHYKGRGFCWLAIALALIVTTLSLMVEPTAAMTHSARADALPAWLMAAFA